MARFFIDIADDDLTHLDAVGSDVEELAQARIEAVDSLVDLFRQGLEQRKQRVASTAVRDVSGTVVYSATLSFRVDRG